MHTTTRLGLDVPDGTDPVSAGPVDFSQASNVLDNAALYFKGTLANRATVVPSPISGTVYQCTDAGLSLLFVYDGTAWHPIFTDGLSQPVGTISQFAGAAVPADPDGVQRWHICDGSAVSRATYGVLNTLLSTAGYPYGAGDGSTTFNLPDLRQRFPLGKAASGTGSTLGGTGGAINHAHNVPGLAVPGLAVPNLAVSNYGHTHTLSSNGGAKFSPQNNAVAAYDVASGNFTASRYLGPNGSTGALGGAYNGVGLYGGTDNGTETGITGTGTTGTGTTGGAATDTNNPPYVVVNSIIKTL